MATLNQTDRRIDTGRNATVVLLLAVCALTTGCGSNRPHRRMPVHRTPARVVSSTMPNGSRTAASTFRQPAPAPVPEPTVDDPASDDQAPLTAPVEQAGRAFDPAPAQQMTDLSGEDAYNSDSADFGSGPVPRELPDPSLTALDIEDGDALGSETADADVNRLMMSDSDVLEQIRKLGGSVSQAGDEVTGIDLSFTRAADTHLHDVARFRALQHLNLTGTDVSDSGLSALADLPALKSLKLRGTSISDAALADIGRLSGLQLLDLSRTRISDAGVVNVARLSGLRYLLLNETRISDATLGVLKSMSNLDGLSLIRTQITFPRQQELREALPGCLVVFDSDEDVSRLEVPDEFRKRDAASISRVAMRLRTVSAPGLRQVAVPRPDSRLAHVVELAQKQPELATHLASIYSQAEDWPSAIFVLQAALDVAPQDREIRYQLAVALAKNGDVPAASEYFEQSVGPALAHYNISVLLHEQMLATCAAHLQRSLALDPNLDPARSWLEELRQQSDESGVRPASAILPADPTLPVIQPRATW